MTELRPNETIKYYKCKSCGYIIEIHSDCFKEIKKPTRCHRCRKRGCFEEAEKVLDEMGKEIIKILDKHKQ
jgi:pentatricopeptide repeat protein